MLVHFFNIEPSAGSKWTDTWAHLQAPPLEIDVLLAPIASTKERYNKPASNERATDPQIIADKRKG